MIREREYAAMSGWAAAAILLAAAALSLWQMVENIKADNDGLIFAWAMGVTFSLLMLVGLFIVNPNEAKVLQLFGRYVGTAKTPGLRSACATSRAGG
jgi:regulator of protease activity HflC (stomatin/prohibitin superfamily)